MSPSAALIGVDGWGDGIAGYGLSSSAVMQDWIDIRELRKARREEKLFAYLRHLGRRSAQQLESALTLALKNFEQVLLLTHVPPFPEACLFAADHDRDNLLPFYCNTALGHLLRQAADHHPCQQITVLCGHTHHSADCDIVPNLRVLVAAAEYGHPQPSRLLKI
jgi:hypothetical protein